jgi:hypothetical protein
MKRRKDDKGHPTLMLRRVSKYFAPPVRPQAKSQAAVSAVKEIIIHSFPDVFVLTMEDFKETGLLPWYDAMQSKVRHFSLFFV